MTFEELEICSFELRRRGYMRQWRYGNRRQGWRLRAAKKQRGEPGWHKEVVIELIEPADLYPYMRLPIIA